MTNLRFVDDDEICPCGSYFEDCDLHVSGDFDLTAADFAGPVTADEHAAFVAEVAAIRADAEVAAAYALALAAPVDGPFIPVGLTPPF